MCEHVCILSFKKNRKHKAILYVHRSIFNSSIICRYIIYYYILCWYYIMEIDFIFMSFYFSIYRYEIQIFKLWKKKKSFYKNVIIFSTKQNKKKTFLYILRVIDIYSNIKRKRILLHIVIVVWIWILYSKKMKKQKKISFLYHLRQFVYKNNWKICI